jgi:hypothetical protein
VPGAGATPPATSSIVHHSNQSDTKSFASCQLGWPTWTKAVHALKMIFQTRSQRFSGLSGTIASKFSQSAVNQDVKNRIP